MGYQLDKDKQKFVRHSLKSQGSETNKCKECGKYYRLPGAIYEPRDQICFTCEGYLRTVMLSRGEIGIYHT